MKIRTITMSDLPEIADLHLRSFPKDHFTSHFSKKMLVEYLTILSGLEDYKYVALDDSNSVAGYLIAGTKYHQAVNIYLKKNFTAVLGVLAASPSFILDKMKTFILKLIGRVGKPTGEISVNIVAVDPDSGSKGVGTLLMDFLENELTANGVKTYILFVRGNNEAAIAFYKKKSFEVVENKGKYLKLRKSIAEKNITP